MSLFEEPEGDTTPETGGSRNRPLADRMRPETLDEFLGQGDAVGEGRGLRRSIENGKSGSLILWGPPGVGKTTLALLIAKHSGLHFEPFSAVLSGVKEVREAVARADEIRRTRAQGTLLFVDEIHRFNKAQQDAFLPYVESGQVVLVGATTENPSFSVIRALISRCRVVHLKPLPNHAIAELLDRALTDVERGVGASGVKVAPPALDQLVLHAGGDARRALTALEAAVSSAEAGDELEIDAIADALQQRALAHDKAGDHHFDLLSALHKSLRNSDPQAAIYWLARILESGADPLQAARRMLAVASEDIGLADPMALQIASSALVAFQNMGLPEGRLPLSQAALYLATAPKSSAVYKAIGAATKEVRSGVQHPVPPHLCNATNDTAKAMGYGEGYQYAHDVPGNVADMACLPDGLKGRMFFKPGAWGFEAKVSERMQDIDTRKKQR